jgi:hypothetical protein
VSFAAITLCVASQRVFIVVVVVVVVVVGFIIDPVRKLLDTPSYMKFKQNFHIFFFKIGSTYELSNSAEQSPS